MKITVGGVVLQEQSLPLSDRFNDVVKQTNELINSKNRKIRRSKVIKNVVGLLGFATAIGASSIARAESPTDMTLEQKGFLGVLADKLIENGKQELDSRMSLIGIEFEGKLREDTIIWKMNDWLQHVLLHTQDFFDNPQILTVFNAIWQICMSFVLLIISKKGFDMVKARVLGTSTIGLSELIIRLLACVVMTFFSLDIMQFGIDVSNASIKLLFSKIEANLIPYQALENTNVIGTIFWIIGYSSMFVILGIQYWLRQINVVLLGVLAPIANTSWIVDGGKILGTLIREFVTLISTPIVHGIILGIGSVLMFEVGTATGSAFIDGMNSVLIGFSTMFLMIFTPSFLRKFTSGSFNPFTPIISMGKGVYGNTIKLAKLIKK